MLAVRTRGFLYYVSLVGVTGARAELPPDLAENLARVRAVARTPVCVGFGIATPEQARAVGRLADGVVVGSAIVARVENADSRAALLDDIPNFVAELKDALRSGAGDAS